MVSSVEEVSVARTSLVENFPCQVLSLQDIEGILMEVLGALPVSGPDGAPLSEAALQRWQVLSGRVRRAFRQAALYGAPMVARWGVRLDRSLQWTDRRLPEGEAVALRRAYLDYLDRIYCAVFRRCLLQTGTALCSPQGHFVLERVRFYRHTRVPADIVNALADLLTFLLEGGPRLEVEFIWKPIGERGWWESS